ncbi:MAG: DUF3696 domain-containing protein [Erysipelotrichales bacterium]|nr:DUF3696 domain-containing protein [Erysipelotrichales bacterium]
MIANIHLKGFKSFYDTILPLNNLTVLTGLNSSGKSSVIQALRMIEKSTHNQENFLLPNHGSLAELKSRFVKDKFSIGVEDQNSNEYTLFLSPDSVEKKVNIIEFPEIIYISASRFGPQTSIPIYNDWSKQNKIGENGENMFQYIETIENNGLILDERLLHKKSEGSTFLFNLRGWLNIISPNVDFNYHLDRKSDTSYSTFEEYRSTNVGFGLSYALPVITALLAGSITSNCIVIIENPEAHIHPKGQTELGRLISLCAEVGTQIIIETHSDHLLDGIRIATKESLIDAEKVNIHWFQLNSNKNTEVYSPILLKDGRLSEWPQGFFDQFEINASKLL